MAHRLNKGKSGWWGGGPYPKTIGLCMVWLFLLYSIFQLVLGVPVVSIHADFDEQRSDEPAHCPVEKTIYLRTLGGESYGPFSSATTHTVGQLKRLGAKDF